MPFFVSGLDLGQEQDYTAHVVLEVTGVQRKWEYTGLNREVPLPETKLLHVETLPIISANVRYIERYPLRTKYKEIAADMEARLRKIPKPRYFALDRTGVGVSAIEHFEHMTPIGVTITTGREAKAGDAEHEYHVPKRDLVSGLQVLLQQRRMLIAADLEHAKTLTRELENFRYKMEKSHVSYEAWREADHDDMVLACAIAAWVGKQVLHQNQMMAYGTMNQAKRQMGEGGVSFGPI